MIPLQSSWDRVETPRVVAALHDTLANAIRAERSRRRWTQEELGERVGMARTRVHDVEGGRSKLTLDEIARFCAAFEVTLLELVGKGDPEAIRALGLTRWIWDS